MEAQGVRNAIEGPDNDKIRRKAQVESSEKQAQKVRQMESRIARLEVDEPRKGGRCASRSAAPHAPARSSRRSTRPPRAWAPSRSARLLQVIAGDRIGVTGPNGAGKTTLLRLLLGRLPPDTGRAGLGTSVAVGEIDQARTGLAEDLPLGDAFETAMPEMAPADVRTLLAKFGLKADQVTSEVGRLSPASGPVRRWRCSRPAASTSSSSTSPPATWTCRRSSFSRRP